MKINIFFIVLSSVFQFFWIYLIARQYNVFLIIFTLLISVALSLYFLNRFICNYLWYNRALLGAIIGFLGGIAATFTAEFALRGGYSGTRISYK